MQTLKELQLEQAEWARRNFPDADNPKYYYRNMLGCTEELGELAHSFLKQEQGIRGTWEQHEAAAQDAVGDLMIYLLHLCSVRGWDLQEILESTWSSVRERDWVRNPQTGVGAVE